MAPQTISEKILSAHAGRAVHAGDLAVCRVDRVIGTDASTPMAIAYFRKMGGTRVFDPSRIILALDHYSPPTSAKTAAFHDEMRAFAREQGLTLFEVGDGISHQIAVERGWVRSGELAIGADSHTVTCGALNLFATGVGSSDLAAAIMTGDIWLRVPETIKITLVGERPGSLSAKDIALAYVGLLGAEGANYQTLEFHGPAVASLTFDDRLVLTNLAVETGAKAAIFPVPIVSDQGAHFAREVTIDVGALTPRVARPHAPDNVVPIVEAIDAPVDMVFIGTCTGGRLADLHEVVRTIDRLGGRVADRVTLVITPASRAVEARATADGTLGRLRALGGVITTVGCGACCGTSGVVPSDGMTVMSTANRNFKARMGNATASIYLASPAACAAAAVFGRIVDPSTEAER